ncbi:hypothetical protein M9Y10_040310 [Tritrichomonas musculus]|uniref:Protein kinase domain-containing protein n=1 Tax=Tritrichomonas musculus TaxID=1915356 RepID=A0ABR2GPU2_9EUKA
MLKFMGLELLKGSTKNDNKVDVFSFGFVVFFFLSGRKMPKISIIEQGCWKKARITSSINKISTNSSTVARQRRQVIVRHSQKISA